MNSTKLYSFMAAALLALTSITQAWHVTGRVICDANGNHQIDAGDLPVIGVQVIVTNSSGSFSGSTSTGADGVYTLVLPDSPDTYGMILNPASLPAGSTILFPSSPHHFSLTHAKQFETVDWLIFNHECVEEEKACWATGGGTIRAGRGSPQHSFGGNVFPGCSPTAGDGGNWNHVAHRLRLHFQGQVINTVRCGNVEGIPPGSTSPVTPFNFIEFEGTGRLRGIGGNRANYNQVFFTARLEDRAEPGGGVDRYYLRVYTANGTTLLLISGDTANPTNIVPVPISTGNFQLHISGCDDPPPALKKSR